MPRVVNLANFAQFTAINLLSDPGDIGGPVVIPNCMQVVLNWTLSDGKTGHNVLYGRSPGIPAPTPTLAETIRTALTSGAAWTNFANLIVPTCALASVTLRSVHEANQPMVQSTGAAATGTSSSTALPSEVALCVTLRTALAGRSNRGRMFLPGYGANMVDTGNVVLAGAVTGTQTWAAGFISIFAGAGLTLVIGQKARQAYVGSTGTSHPARAAGSVPVTQLVVRDNHWDSMRRRGLK